MRTGTTRGIWLGTLVAVAISACSSVGSTSTTAPDVSAAPADWTTYAGDAFSIAYPNDWEVFSIDETLVDEVVGDAGDFRGGILMAAGLPGGDGSYSPNVNVVVEPAPVGGDLDRYVELSRRGIESLFSSYEISRSDRTTIGGRDAVVVTGSYDLSELSPGTEGRWWVIQTVALAGDTGWTVSCGASGPDEASVAGAMELCRTVTASFRIAGP